MLDSANISENIRQVMSRIESSDAVGELVGACRRRLEEDPENPSLLLLEGLALISGPQWRDGVQDIRAGLNLSLPYLPDPSAQIQLVEALIDECIKLSSDSIHHVLDATVDSRLSPDVHRATAGYCYKRAEPFGESHHRSIEVLLSSVAAQVVAKREGRKTDVLV